MPNSSPAELLPVYLDRWSLQTDGPAIAGNNATVQPVRTADGVPAMLRLDPGSEFFADELRTLLLWNGDGAVQVFDHDAANGVMLLERLDHTRNLESLPVEEGAVIAGQLRARLSRPAPDGLRALESTVERWIAEFPEDRTVPRYLLDAAVGLCRELGPGAGDFLVNSDQHYQNILAGEREPWLVIDPHVFAGDREFGIATLLWGRLNEASPQRILDIFVEVEGLDDAKARAWTFVDSVAKWVSQPQGRWATDCARIAHELMPARSL
ncbi:MAG TPA: aminoglycoside phosphotransferase family protein [Mycobacteriales bacterium]|nr:aminoglycoside phosphotransferase family protein [Mycobacteriales bacterium]